VFLFPSRIIEGFGMVNAEAMACGLPILGTGIGGSAEVMLDGETGFRFAPGDHQELGRRLVQLAEDRSLLEQLSAGALRAVLPFEYGRVLDRVEALLASVAHAPLAGPATQAAEDAPNRPSAYAGSAGRAKAR
jgi:glycosyltransferase involved in cell wall biosynthesis